MNATGCRIGLASLALTSAGLASLLVLSLALPCDAREPGYEFVDRLVSKRDYVLSPSGNHVLVYGRLPDGQSPWPARYHVVVHEIDEAGLGNYRDLSPLRLRRINWSRRTDRDELFGVRKGRLYRIQLDGSRRRMADNRPEDMTPANMKGIKILLRDPGGNGKLVISGVERGRGTRGLYRCELDLLPENHCEWMGDESDEIKGHLFDYAGRIVARLRWDPADSDPSHLEIPDESTASGWRSTVSYDPSETSFKSVTLADENGDLLALSNHNRDVVALVRFNTRSGRETVVVSRHEHDIGEVFENTWTEEPLATSSFPDLQRIECRHMGARDAAELLAKGAKINPCSLAAGLRSSTMIMAGTQDRVTHPDQSLALHDELRARGIPSRISLRRHGHEVLLRHLVINIFANAADFFHEELVRNSTGNPKETASLERPPEDRVEECLAPRRSIRAFLRQKMGFKK